MSTIPTGMVFNSIIDQIMGRIRTDLEQGLISQIPDDNF